MTKLEELKLLRKEKEKEIKALDYDILQLEYSVRPEEYREHGSEYGGEWVKINTLPVGTTFFVCNGHWNGQIVMHKGHKALKNAKGTYDLTNAEYWASIEINEGTLV